MGILAPVLIKILPSLPAPLFQLVAYAAAWWLKYTGAKEEARERFEESVREIQARRSLATRAADDLAQALKNLDAGMNDLEPKQDERGPPA